MQPFFDHCSCKRSFKSQGNLIIQDLTFFFFFFFLSFFLSFLSHSLYLFCIFILPLVMSHFASDFLSPLSLLYWVCFTNIGFLTPLLPHSSIMLIIFLTLKLIFCLPLFIYLSLNSSSTTTTTTTLPLLSFIIT